MIARKLAEHYVNAEHNHRISDGAWDIWAKNNAGHSGRIFMCMSESDGTIFRIVERYGGRFPIKGQQIINIVFELNKYPLVVSRENHLILSGAYNYFVTNTVTKAKTAMPIGAWHWVNKLCYVKKRLALNPIFSEPLPLP